MGRRALDGDPPQPQAAIAHFDSSIAAGRSVFAATRDRGEARIMLAEQQAPPDTAEVERALVDLEAARQMEPDPHLLWLLGKAYSAVGRYQEAAQAYEDYELATDDRAVKRLARLKVAELRARHDSTAAHLLRDRLDRRVEPEDNTVAVLAFVPHDSSSVEDQEMCRALNVLVTADLLKVEALRAVAAAQLDILYGERGCNYECRQYLDPASVPAQNDVLPARFIVTGTYGTLPNNQMLLGATCFDVKKKQFLEAPETGGLGATGGLADFFSFEAELVLDLLAAMDILPRPAEDAAIRRKPAQNLRALTLYAHGLYLKERGDFAGAGAAFQEAVDLEPDFSQADDEAAGVEVGKGPAGEIEVPPPAPVDAVAERAMSSAVQLGQGLIPDEDAGQSTDASTENVVSVHGSVSVRITGTVQTGRR